MSMPHLLMLGLIDGATVGLVVTPPAEVGDLAQFSISQFYVVDGKSRRKLTKHEVEMMRRTIAIYKRTQLKSVKDFKYYAKLMADAAAHLHPARKAA